MFNGVVSRQQHGNRYPWTKWFNRGEFILKRGRDYTIWTHGMIANLRAAAERHGLRANVKTFVRNGGEGLRVTIYPKVRFFNEEHEAPF